MELSMDQTFREHEGDDCADWMNESVELAGYIEPVEDSDTVGHPVTALSGFSLGTWLSR
jgi:hypothetical protein